MKKVTFPLKMEMKKAAVGDLHQALVFLGLAVSEPEKTARLFGQTTLDAVVKLQRENQLQPTSIVDEATANLINQLLKDRGAPDHEIPQEARIYEVKGMVRDADGRGKKGLPVLVFELLLRERKLLGEAKTFDNGFYELHYQPPLVREKPKKEFAIIAVVTKPDGKEWASKPVYKADKLEWINFFEGKSVV